MASGMLPGFVVGFVSAITRRASDSSFSGAALLLILSISAMGATYLYFDREMLKSRIQQLVPDLIAGMRIGPSLLVALCVPLGVLGTLHWGLTTPQTTKTLLQSAPLWYWFGIAVPVVLIGPFAEEIFFRGFVWDRLSAAMPAGRAGVISAALFLGTHIVNGILAPVLVLPLAIVLTTLRLRGLGLGMCVLAHTLYNGTIILGNFIQTNAGQIHAPL
jgi:membrane protease YdiL (CAAX protease family)